jgi:hypothetical protein
MERLWSQADATGGKHWQTPPRRKRLRKSDRQPVATPRNDETFDGKEEVDPRTHGQHLAPISSVCQLGNGPSRAYPARDSRKFPRAPADPRTEASESPARAGNPRLFPLMPEAP